MANFQNAYNYAKKYWNVRNVAYSYYTDRNCANFCSQILNAAGVPLTSNWKNGTYAFVNCGGLRDYFTKTYNVSYKSNPSASAINPGDIIYIGSGHVMFVMRKTGSKIYASGNTNNRDCMAVSTSCISGVLQTSKLFSK